MRQKLITGLKFSLFQFFLFFLLSPVLYSQNSQMPLDSSNWLQTCSIAGYGDLDEINVIFFEIPDTIISTLYFAVYDPGCDNTSPDQGTGGPTNFYLVGGSSTLSSSVSRQISYSTPSNARTGTVLSSYSADDAGAYQNGWYYFPVGVQPSQGEHIGNKYYFKIVVDATNSVPDIKNAYQVDVSLTGTNYSAPTDVTGAASFAYNLCFDLDNDGGATPWNLYPYVPESANTTDHVVFHNYDFDNDGVIDIFSRTGKDLPVNPTISGDGGQINQEYLISAANALTVATDETNGTWQYYFYSNSGSTQNASEVWVSLDTDDTPFTNGTPLRMYSSPITNPNAADHVVITYVDGIAIADNADTEQISLQIVDSSGDPANYSRNIYVSLADTDGNIAVIDSVNGTDIGDTSSTVITTDDWGLGFFDVKRNNDGTGDSEVITVTATVEWDGTDGSDSLASPGTDTINVTFYENPNPTISSVSNQSFLTTDGTTLLSDIVIDHPSLDSPNGKITTVNDLQISIPSDLDALFDTTIIDGTDGLSMIVTGAGSGAVNGTVSYSADDKIVYITVTGDFDQDQYLTITGLKLMSFGSSSSGSLELSWDGGTAFSGIDDKLLNISDPNLDYTWIGITDNSWGTTTNWSPNGTPGGGDQVLIQAAVYPLIMGSARTVDNMTISSGGILNLSGQTLTCSTSFDNSGTLRLDGTEDVSNFIWDSDSGTADYTGVGTPVLGNTYNNLTISGTLTLGATVDVNGDLDVTGTLDQGGAFDINLAGDADFTGGNYTKNSGTFVFDGGVAQNLSSDGNDLGDIQLSTASTVLTISEAADFDDVTIDASTSLILAAGITVGGDWTNNNSFVSSTFTVTFDGSGSQTINTGGTAVTQDFENIIFNGTGDYTVSTALDVDDTLTVTDSTGVTFSDTVDSVNVVLTDTSGTISFSGDTTVSTSLTTAVNGFNLIFSGTTNSISGATSFTNTGNLTFSGTTSSFPDGVTSNGGPGTTFLSGTLDTTNNNINLGVLELTGNSLIDTGAVAGNITFSGTVNTDNNPWTLGLTAGTGTITFSDVVGTADGNAARPSTLTINSATSVAQNANVFLSSGLVQNGTDWTVGALTLDVDGTISGTGSLTSTGATAINIGTDLTIATFTPLTSTVTFDEGTASDAGAYIFNNLILAKDAEADTISSSGIWTVNAALTLTTGTWTAGNFTHLIAGNWDSSSASFSWDETNNTINLTSTDPAITTEGGALDPFNSLTLDDGGVLLSNTNVDGTLLLSSGTLNPSTFTLTVAALDHQVAAADIAGTTGTVLVTNASLGSSITMDGGTISFSGGAVSLTGNSDLNTTPTGGSIVLGSTFDNNFTLTVNSGASAIDITAAIGGITPVAAVSFTGSQFNLGANITTNNSDLVFTSPVVLTNNSVLSSGAGIGNITFSGTVNTDNNPWTLGLTAGTGTITFSDVVGTADGNAARPSTLTINSATSVAQNANVFLSGGLVQNGTDWAVGALTLDVDGTISGTGSLTSTAATAINIGTDLTIATFTPLTSTVTFDEGTASDAGAYTFNNLILAKDAAADTISSSGIWTVNAALTLTTGTWTAGNYTHLIAGNWDSSSASFSWDEANNTINLTSTNPAITTEGGAADPFNNLSLDDGAGLLSNTNVDGTLLLSSGTLDPSTFTLTVATLDHQVAAADIAGTTGTVSVTNATLGSSITMDGGTISFSGGAVSLTGNSVLNTTLTGGSIVLGSTFDNNFTLTVNSGASAIDITANIGSITPVAALSFTGSQFNLGANITTNNSDLIFTSPVVLTNNSVLSSGAGIGNITFSGTVNTDNNPWTLGLTAGTGTITFSDVVGIADGNAARPSTLTINSATSVAQNANVFLSGGLVQNGTDWTVGALTLDVDGTISGTGSLTSTGATAINIGTDLTIATFTPLTSTVTFDEGTASAAGAYTFNNLILAKDAEADTISSSGIWTVNAALTLTTGTWTAGNFTHLIAGNWDSSSASFSWDETNNTINLTSTDPAITTEGGAADPFNNLSLDDGGVLGSNTNVDGTLLLSSGTLDPSTFTLTVATLDHQVAAADIAGTTGTVAVANASLGSSITMDGGTITFSGGAVSLTGDSVLNTTLTGGSIVLGSTFDNNFTLTVDSGAGAIDITANIGGITPVAALSFTGSQINLGANITTNNSDLVFFSPVYLTNNSVLDTGAGAGNITFSSTVDNGAGGPWDLDLSAWGTITFTGIVGTTPIDAVTITAGTVDQQSSFTIGGFLQNNGTWGTGDNVVSIGGNFDNNSIFNAGTSTITVRDDWDNTGGSFDDGTSTVNLGGGAAGPHVINNAGGVNSFNILNILTDTYNSTSGAMDVASTLTISSGGLTHNTGAADNLAAASIVLSGGDLTVTSPSTYSTTGDITVNNGGSALGGDGTGTVGQDLVVSAGTVNGSGDMVITRDVLLSGGTLVNNGRTLTVGRNWNQSGGTLTATSGTVSLTNAGTATIDAIDSFYNLTVTAAATQNTNITVSNQLTTGTGVFATGTNDLDVDMLDHDSGGSISGTSGAITIDDATAANNITKTGGTVTVTGGTLFDLTGPVTIDTGAGIINLATNFSGAQNLILTAGTINISSDLGTTVDLSSLTVTGLVNIFSQVQTTNNILFNNNVVLTGNTSMDSTAGNITFTGLLNDDGVAAAKTLDLDSGGLITLTEAVGGVDPLGDFTISSATTGVNASSTISSNSLTMDDSNGSLGFVDLNGAVLVPFGFSSTNGTTFDNTGASITTTDNPITINHTGTITLVSNLSSSDGNITIDSNGAAINIDGDINTADGNVTVNDSMDLTDIYAASPNTISIVSSGAGSIVFNGDIDGTTSTDLTVSSASGNIQFINAAIGSALGEAVGDITISGNNIDLYSVGSTAQAGSDNTLSVTATNLITMNGTDYYTGNDQRYNTTAVGSYILLALSASGDMNAGVGDIQFGDINIGDVYVDFVDPLPIVTLQLRSNITCSKFVFYGGTINLNGNSLYTTNNSGGDFVVFGSAFDPDDPDWGGALDDNRFDYQDRFDSALLYDPGIGNYDAAFGNLDGSLIETGANFYVNGADLPAAADWNLNVLDNNIATPSYNLTDEPTSWGTPYNVYFKGYVDFSLLNDAALPGNNLNGTVAASTSTVVNADSGHRVTHGLNNTVYTDVTGAATNDAKGWQFSRPEITDIRTVWDNYLKVTFNYRIENTNDQIQTAITDTLARADDLKMNINGGGAVAPSITNAYSYIDENDPVNGAASVSTTGAGDLKTFYLLVNDSWNTDADGGDDGQSAGPATSTDSSGTNKSVIPDFGLFKSMLYSAGSQAAVRDYGSQGDANADRTKATADFCPPLIIDVTTGNHGLTGDNYDYHNYILTTYSEPIIVTTDDDLTTYIDESDFPLIDQSCDVYPLNGSDYLCDIQDNQGADVEVIITGIMTYEGSVYADGTESEEGFYSGTTGFAQINTLERTSAYELQINIAAYNDGTWPGYLGQTGMDIMQPENYTGIVSSNIRDVRHNGAKITTGAVTVIGTGWDVEPPFVAPYKSSTTIYEIIPEDEDVNAIIDRFEFHILDNAGDAVLGTDLYIWDTINDHPDSLGGIRDSSLQTLDAFTFQKPDNNWDTLDATQSFDTSIQNDYFSVVGINNVDDPYFSIDFDDTAIKWDTLAKINTKYNEDTGFLTDLAGNRLRSYAARAVESIPPNISLSLAVPGNDWVYVKFSELVYGDTSFGAIDAGDFYITGTSLSLSSVEDWSGGTSNLEYKFNLSSTLTENDIVKGKIAIRNNSIYDSEGNSARDQLIYRISDLGFFIVEPVWASDGIHSDDIREGSSLTDFDGTGRLLDRDILLQARINASSYENSSISLYYDADVPESLVINNLWLPIYHEELAPLGNYSSRYVNSTSFLSNGLQEFTISSSDEDMETGKTIEFFFMLNGLPCVNLSDSDDIWSFEPWSFQIQDITEQKSGVTILNNIINPLDGDEAVLIYELSDPGVVTAQIFALNGSLVRILQRGRQAAGTYQYLWDGKNNSGQVVARGVYFIRVVGPEMDEIRKVMVVK